MATPHVSGVFALMLAVNPDLSADDIEQMLISGLLTDDLGISGADNLYGYGLINARKAVNTALTSLSSNPIVNSYLSSSISTIEFSPGLSETVFETRTVGDDAININSIDYNAAWLDLTSLGLVSGVENWRLTIDRLGLTEGLYRETLSFNTSANVLNVEVILQVNPPTQRYQVGPLLIELINTENNNSIQINSSYANNAYNFDLNGLASGDYRIRVSSDLNGNGENDAGEASAQSEVFTVSGNRTLSDLVLAWDRPSTLVQ